MRTFRKEWPTKRFYGQKLFEYHNKMVQILQQCWSFQGDNKGDVETREPQTQTLGSNSFADSLNHNFLVYFAEMLSCFLKKTNKRKVRKCQVRKGLFTLIFTKYIQQWIIYYFKIYIYDWELLDITAHEVN